MPVISYIIHFPVLMQTCSTRLFDLLRKPIVATCNPEWLPHERAPGAAGKIETVLDPSKTKSKKDHNV